MALIACEFTPKVTASKFKVALQFVDCFYRDRGCDMALVARDDCY